MSTKIISPQHRSEFDQRQWARLINSVSGFKSANLIGTISPEGNSNLCVVSSVVHLGSNPPLLGYVSRPHSEESPRHTLMNIESSGEFTVNMVTQSVFKKAHQTSARYKRGESEFEAVGLEELFLDGCPVPFVKESPLKMHLSLRKVYPIPENSTFFVIGEIKTIHVDSSSILDDGYVDIEALGAVCISGLDGYHSTQRLARMEYAKPDREPVEREI